MTKHHNDHPFPPTADDGIAADTAAADYLITAERARELMSQAPEHRASLIMRGELITGIVKAAREGGDFYQLTASPSGEGLLERDVRQKAWDVLEEWLTGRGYAVRRDRDVGFAVTWAKTTNVPCGQPDTADDIPCGQPDTIVAGLKGSSDSGRTEVRLSRSWLGTLRGIEDE